MDKKELSKAIEALKEDGGFPDLLRAAEKRLGELDPSFKSRQAAQHVSPEARNAASEDIASFLTDIQQLDK